MIFNNKIPSEIFHSYIRFFNLAKTLTDVTIIQSFRKELIFTFPAVDVCRAREPGSTQASMMQPKSQDGDTDELIKKKKFKFRFCLTTMSNIMIIL